jgi:hypothetical protein
MLRFFRQTKVIAPWYLMNQYKDKLDTQPDSAVYEILLSMARSERKVQKVLSKHKTALPIDLNFI